MKVAVVNNSTNVVENVIELEVGANWSPPVGYFIVWDENLNIGDSYELGK